MKGISTPADFDRALRQDVTLPAGEDERFAGYGLMGMPFASRDVLGLRHWYLSSVGPGYTAVWHRDPDGRWTFYADIPPGVACPRYAGAIVDHAPVTRIDTTWTGDHEMEVAIPAADLHWRFRLAAGPAIRAMNGLAAGLPAAAWRSPLLLTAMGWGAGALLRTGPLALHGRMPNGQRFRLRPHKLWMARESAARLGDRSFGTPSPRGPQHRIGDFRIPRRGLFAFGTIRFDAFDADRHRAEVTRLAPAHGGPP